jgi:hypothetical protein
MRVIAAKNEALQALGIAKNVGWNAFAFDFQEIDQSVSCADDVSVNHRIGLGQLRVMLCDGPKRSELLERILPLV